MASFCSSGRTGGGTPYMFYTSDIYPPLPAIVTVGCCSRCVHWKKTLNAAHVLRSDYCCCHSLMLSLNIVVCARRAMNFDTIIAFSMVYLLALANSHTFSSCFMRRARGSVSWYAPMIHTESSLSFISSIPPYALKRLLVIYRSVTWTNPFSWYFIGDMNAGSMEWMICFFRETSTELYRRNSA